MGLKASELARDMAAAFTQTLKGKVPEIRSFADAEAKKLAQTLLMIEKLRLTGKIDKEEAELHLEIQRNATRSVLLTIEGLGALAAEQAINAALDSVRKAVNKALKFTLL
jgi:hypothetical protein